VELYSGKRPIYIAVTVPDRRELEDRLVMEGLVFAVRGTGERSRIDVEKTLKNLTEVYKYRGLLDEDGYFDESVYKDENSTKLVQNYAAAWVRIAHQSLRDGNKELAKMALERAQKISPRFAGASYTMGVMYYQDESYAEAESIFQSLVRAGEGDAQVLRLLGMSQEAQGRVREALQSYQAAVNMDPEDRENHLNLIQFLMSMSQPEQALIVLDRWIQAHPDDKLFLDARPILLETIDSLRKASN
jgi:tetratricopeptide (TPR) repeat protein